MTASEAAELAGIDLSLIDESLRVSPQERAVQHQAALEIALQLESAYRASRQHDGTQSTSAETVRR